MGAPESNAGDAFHFWWAATQALALIRPDACLEAISLEGLGKDDDPEDAYETVDLAEYYGGSGVASATRLVLSQLKHSTRHPTTPWTAAVLCKKRRRVGSSGQGRSVAADLAGAYARILSDFGADVAAKTSVALVTNRPADPALVEAIAEASKWVRIQPQPPTKAAMLRALDESDRTIIETIGTAVGTRLSSRQFGGFIASLDLSNAGSLGHSALARSVQATTSLLSPDRAGDSARRLFHLVQKEALPGGGRGRLTAADVLAELGVPDVSDLYPAPARFTDVSDPIVSRAAPVIAAALVAGAAGPSTASRSTRSDTGHGGWVIAHGPAGAGKTTTVLQVRDHLPPGSKLILFDCYGAGDYLDTGFERHTPHRFVMQVVNQLAQQCGTPLLVSPPQSESDLWRRLRSTLDNAVANLDAGAVLVLAVDAADNAAFAARQREQVGFLRGLADFPLPSRVAVVLTARTHRVDLLGMPRALPIPVAPFDPGASAQHLRRHRSATDEVAEEFHIRTAGNPRAQFYALTQPGNDLMDTATFLESCEKTPEPIFADLLQSAISASGADTGGARWLAALLALARPVPIPTLAAALHVDPAAVLAFAAGLEPGVRLTGDLIAFRDEDFETYIRERVDPADVIAAHGDLATMFLDRRYTDAEAAGSVAEHLDAAGRTADLLALVLDEERPVGIADGFRREQVQSRRLVLAARAAATSDDAAAAVRIASRGCDTASRLETLSRLVSERFDLVARYADVELFRSHALRQNRHDWLAPTLVRVAAALSRDPARTGEAQADLTAAKGWLHRWVAESDGDGRFWAMSEDDVGASVEAVFRVEGVEAAATELMRWRPTRFVAEAAEAFAERVRPMNGSSDPAVSISAMRDALAAAGVPLSVQLPIATRLRPWGAGDESADGPSTSAPTATHDDTADAGDVVTTSPTDETVDDPAAVAERTGDVSEEADGTSTAEIDTWAAWVRDLASNIAVDQSPTPVSPSREAMDEATDPTDDDEDSEGDVLLPSSRVELLEALNVLGEKSSAAVLAERWATELPSTRWEFSTARSWGVNLLHFHAIAAALGGGEFELNSLLPSGLRPPPPDLVDHDLTDNKKQDRKGIAEASGRKGQEGDSRRRDRDEWFTTVRPIAAAVELSVNAALGLASAADVERAVRARLVSNHDRASRRWFTLDHGYLTWASVMVDAISHSGAPTALVDDLAAGSVRAVGDEAPSVMLAVAARAALRGLGADVVVGVCRRAVDALDDGSHSAGERLEILGEAAELTARLDDEVGRHLFDRAVDAATGINDEAAHLLKVHADLAERADVPAAQAPGVARDLVAVAEGVARHVSDAGSVPYAAVAAAASRLHPLTGLRAVTRWDDQDRQTISSTLLGALKAAVEHGGIPAWQALCLDHLIEDDRRRLDFQLDLCTRMLLDGAAGRTRARRGAQRAGRWLRRRVPTRHQPALAQRLLDWASAHDLHSSVASDVVTVAGFTRSTGADRDRESAAGAPTRGRDSATESDGPGTEAPRRVDDQAWRTLGDDVAALDGGYGSGDRVRTLISDALGAATPADRTAALDAVTAVSSLHADVALSAISEAMTSWFPTPPVRDWATENLPQLLSRWLDVLAWRSDTARLLSDLQAFGDDDDIRRAVLLALPATHTELTSYGWRNVTALLGLLCPPAAAADALLGLLSDRAAAVASTASPAPRLAVATSRSAQHDMAARPAVDEQVGTNPVAGLLWSAFGHPRRAVRWRAAHVVRDLLTHPEMSEAAPIAHDLVDCLDRNGIDLGAPDREGWRDPSLQFYRLSAMVGLLVALDRVADERPNVLAPHLDVFVRHATSRELPHAQIRELARRTALSLTVPTPGSERSAAQSDARAALWGVNRPDLFARKRGRSHGLNDRQISEERRYRFDSMDTIPYWYAPLARVFDFPVDIVAEHAEKWILDAWGHDEADWWKDARELRDERSYERMGHRQGAIPAEENLRLYLEYHAMMTTAGALIDASSPIVAESWDDTDPWQEWLSRHVTNPNGWLSDYSTPTPPEPTLFVAVDGSGLVAERDDRVGQNRPDGSTPSSVSGPVRASTTDFDDILGLDPSRPDRVGESVVISKWVRLSRTGHSISMHATSAMVSPRRAADLQRALAAATNPTDWKLPTEGEDSFEVDAGDYQLHGWIADDTGDRETLDQHDSYAAQLSATVPLPGVAFRQATRSTLGHDGLSLVSSDGKGVASADQWADREPGAHGDGSSTASSGVIVRVDRATLLRHLHDTGKSLILEVQIDRHWKRGGAEYQPPANRIYLLDEHGTIIGS